MKLIVNKKEIEIIVARHLSKTYGDTMIFIHTKFDEAGENIVVDLSDVSIADEIITRRD